MQTLLIIVSTILIVVILVFHFANLYKIVFPNKIRLIKVRIPRLFYLITLAFFLVSVGVFFSIRSFGFLSSNPNSNKGYYKGYDYWHEYSCYRNEQLTKIYQPDSEDIEVIYGNWQEMEFHIYDIEETPEGFKIEGEDPTIYKYYNDSILKLESNYREDFLYNYFFSKDGKLLKIESLDTDEKWIYKYNQGKFNQRTFFSAANLKEKHTAHYNGKYDYTVSIWDADGNLNSEIIFECNFDGLPVRKILKKEFEKKGLSLSQERIRTVFDVFKTVEMSYQGETQDSKIKDLESGQEILAVEGKGREILLWEPSSNIGKKSETVHYEFEYDEKDNWVMGICYENNIAQFLALRKFAYRDGRTSGSIDPTKVDFLTTSD